MDVVRGDNIGTITPACRRDCLLVDIGNDQRCAGLVRPFNQGGADMSDSLNCDPPVAQVRTPEATGSRGPEAMKHAVGRRGRRITGTVFDDAPDMGCFTSGNFKILDRGSDIFAGDETTLETLDCASQCAQQRFGLAGSRIGNDNGLAAAGAKADKSRLVGHGPRQAQDIAQSIGLAGV